MVHVYLTADELATTCREMFYRDVTEVALHDEVRADDPAHPSHRHAHRPGGACGGAGQQLLVDALACQLAVHILRGHADVVFRDRQDGGLTSVQERAVRDFVEDHLHQRITLADLAALVGLSRCRFACRFRCSTGHEPARVRLLDRRVARAKLLLTQDRDAAVGRRPAVRVRRPQSHLTRVFRGRVAASPPGRFRARG